MLVPGQVVQHRITATTSEAKLHRPLSETALEFIQIEIKPDS
jgi:hypothetical protein